MNAPHQYHGDVGVVVTGQARINQIHKDNALAPLEEEKFYRLTGLRASWQARVCLMFLIEFVDVQIFELRQVWGRELQLVDLAFVVRTSPYQKWAFYLAAFVFVAHALCLIFQAQMGSLSLVEFGNMAARMIGFGGFAILLERRIYYPYRIAKRINASLDRVNVFLPEALDRARLRLHAFEESV